MHPTQYTLPSSPTIIVQDRFSILDSDDPQVPFWPLLQTLLQQPHPNTSSLVDLLETIAITLHGKSSTDYAFLRAFLRQSTLVNEETFFSNIFPVIKTLALKLPALFPTHHLPILSALAPRLTLTREQAACLVAHQFLCTLVAPVWQDGFQDLHIWYGGEQPHEGVVRAYLTALFAYFERLASGGEASLLSEDNSWDVTYTLCAAESTAVADLVHSPRHLTKLRVLQLDEPSTRPRLLGLPHGASVISANKFIGFGRTGTQEETHVGASPECYPAVLVTPPLTSNQGLIIRGAEAMLSIDGYGRDARVGKVLTPGAHARHWATRTMLFVDALELDMADASLGVPVDLQPGNVRREILKAWVGFAAPADRAPYESIVTGYWGCRSFGGDPRVKSLVQWCVASAAGCDEMIFVCAGPEQAAFGDELEGFVREVEGRGVHVGRLVEVLLGLKPEGVRGGSVLESVLDNLGEGG